MRQLAASAWLDPCGGGSFNGSGGLTLTPKLFVGNGGVDIERTADSSSVARPARKGFGESLTAFTARSNPDQSRTPRQLVSFADSKSLRAVPL
jgi:hypothetical protein